MGEDKDIDGGYEQHRRDMGRDYEDGGGYETDSEPSDVEDYEEEETAQEETETTQEEAGTEGTETTQEETENSQSGQEAAEGGQKEAGEGTETDKKGGTGVPVPGEDPIMKKETAKKIGSFFLYLPLNVVYYIGAMINSFVRAVVFGDPIGSHPFDIRAQANKEMEADSIDDRRKKGKDKQEDGQEEGKKDRQKEKSGQGKEERGKTELDRVANLIKDKLCTTLADGEGFNIGKAMGIGETDVINVNGTYMFKMGDDMQTPLTAESIRDIGQKMFEDIVGQPKGMIGNPKEGTACYMMNSTPNDLLRCAVRAGVMQSMISLSCEDLMCDVAVMAGQTNVIKDKHLCDINPADGFGNVSFDLRYKDKDGVKTPYIEASWDGKVLGEVSVMMMLDKNSRFKNIESYISASTVLDEIKNKDPERFKKLEETAEKQCDRCNHERYGRRNRKFEEQNKSNEEQKEHENRETGDNGTKKFRYQIDDSIKGTRRKEIIADIRAEEKWESIAEKDKWGTVGRARNQTVILLGMSDKERDALKKELEQYKEAHTGKNTQGYPDNLISDISDRVAAADYALKSIENFEKNLNGYHKGSMESVVATQAEYWKDDYEKNKEKFESLEKAGKTSAAGDYKNRMNYAERQMKECERLQKSFEQEKPREDVKNETQENRQEDTRENTADTQQKRDDEAIRKDLMVKNEQWKEVAGMDGKGLAEMTDAEREEIKYYADKYVEENKTKTYQMDPFEQGMFMNAKNASMNIEKYESELDNLIQEELSEFHAQQEQQEEPDIDLDVFAEGMNDETAGWEAENEMEEPDREEPDMDEEDLEI